MNYDRIAGCLVGTLVGDALGRPFEGWPISDLDRLHEHLSSRIKRPRSWSHSDDGEMMLNVGLSIQSMGGIDDTHLLGQLARGHEPARGYGKGTRAAFREFGRSGSPALAARVFWPEGSRGNGGAVRVAPVAAFLFATDDVARVARRSAAVTHIHLDALAGAEEVALAVASELRGCQFVASRDLEKCRGRHPRYVAECLGHGVLAAESVPAALWAAAFSTGFEDAVVRAVGLGGDTDSIGAMAGAVAGARFGLNGIPLSWKNALEPGALATTLQLSDFFASRQTSVL